MEYILFVLIGGAAHTQLLRCLVRYEAMMV